MGVWPGCTVMGKIYPGQDCWHTRVRLLDWPLVPVPAGRGLVKRDFLIAILLLPALAACTSGAPLLPAKAGPTVSGDGTCHAGRVVWAVGKNADEQVMRAVWKQSGSGLIRPIAPGQAVTRDFRPDRINVHIDAGNVITQVGCG